MKNICFTIDSNFNLISSISFSKAEPETIPEPAVNSIFSSIHLAPLIAKRNEAFPYESTQPIGEA